MTFILRSPRIDRVTVPDNWGRTGCLVVIPARNEADRIADCLAALDGQDADALVVANNCTDATAELAVRSGAAVVDCGIPDGGVGAARRLGAKEGWRRMSRLKHIMTSDADCLVAPDWVAANQHHLNAGRQRRMRIGPADPRRTRGVTARAIAACRAGGPVP